MQAVANLLMYPDVIPVELRVDAALRAVSAESDGYLRIAGAVAISHLAELGFPDGSRAALLDALLDLIATDAGVAAVRASSAVGSFLDRDSVAEVVAVLTHPNRSVRRNLVTALSPFLDGDGLGGLLRKMQTTDPDSVVGVPEQLAADGINLDGPVSILPVLPYLPDYREWANSYQATPAEI